jgi:CRP-like cAMP-binding protein
MALKPDIEPQARELLRKLPLFGGCSDEQIAALTGGLTGPKDVNAGKVVMMDQEIGKTLYLLAKGSVSVWKRVGGEKMKLASLAAPNFFGERTMFEESPASALVKADETCTLFYMERIEFDKVTQRFPNLAGLIRINMEAVRAQRLGPPKPPSEDSPS